MKQPRIDSITSFSARILKLGINPVVDPPSEVLDILFQQAGRSKGPIPVCGSLNGVAFTQTLVKYRGAWRLYINGPMLRSAGLKVGDTAVVAMEFDPTPRSVPVPPQLRRALTANKRAASAFRSLSASRRNEILKYLGSLKTEAAIEKNVSRVIKHLTGDETDDRLG